MIDDQSALSRETQDEYTPLLAINNHIDYDSTSCVKIDNKTARHVFCLDNVPDEYSDIDDMIEHINVHDLAPRCMVIGLDHCCRVYHNLKVCINDIMIRLQRRKRRLESVHVKPETIWIDVQAPTATDLKFLENVFELHPLTTEDLADLTLHEKYETYDDYMFVVFGAQIDDRRDSAMIRKTPINVIVFSNLVLTTHWYPIQGLDLGNYNIFIG
jgi:Mg2+ and Co2+ transporter CorA